MSNGTSAGNGAAPTKVERSAFPRLVAGGGATAVVAAALWSAFASLESNWQQQLRVLRDASCRFGTAEQPGIVHAVDFSTLKGLRLPAGIRCPLVIRGLEAAEAWQDLARLGSVEELKRRTPTKVAFDSSPNGEFAYWDNSSVLAATVHRVSVLRPSYTKVRAKRKDFFAALDGKFDASLGAVRYGGDVSEFSREIARSLEGPALSALAPESATASRRSLWLGTPGSFSTAHYDNFHNVFVMLGGEKEFLLAPPTDAHLFKIFPGTHPLARQARWHFGRRSPKQEGASASPASAAAGPRDARLLAVTLRSGEALFLPSGWIHHVTALSTAISVALTSNPAEHGEFNRWMLQGHEVLPFIRDGWTAGRMIGSLRVFIPALLRDLGFGIDPRLANFNPLHIMVNDGYGQEMRNEIGIPRLPKWHLGCVDATVDDRKAAEAAALNVAARFKQFQEDLIPVYIMPYLETALSKVAFQETDPARIMATTVAFVEMCLLPPERATS